MTALSRLLPANNTSHNLLIILTFECITFGDFFSELCSCGERADATHIPREKFIFAGNKFSQKIKDCFAVFIDPLHKWRLNLNTNTWYILSLAFMFEDEGIFT